MSGSAGLRFFLGALPIAFVLALWHGLSITGAVPAALLPPPSAVLRRLGEQLANAHYLLNAATTLLRLLAGFVLALVIGVGVGLAAATHRTLDALFTPVVRVLAPVPKIALYPALVLILGFEHGSKIALVAADATFPILLATYQGAKGVERTMVWSALAAGAGPHKVLLSVVLPAALPTLLAGCRIALVISSIVVFLAEMIMSTDGLGHVLVYAARSFETVDMLVPLVTISLLSLLLNAGLNGLSARLLAGFPHGA